MFLVDQHFRTEEKLGRDQVKYDSYESIYERLRTGNAYLKHYIIFSKLLANIHIVGQLYSNNVIYLNLFSQLGVNEFLDETDTISREAVDALAVRGIRKTDDSKYVFSRDLKQTIVSLYGYPTETIEEYARKITCPHLVILATRHPERWKIEEEHVNAIRNVYKQTNPQNYGEETVDGNHAIHLTHPENVWLAIQSFLIKHQHKL